MRGSTPGDRTVLPGTTPLQPSRRAVLGLTYAASLAAAAACGLRVDLPQPPPPVPTRRPVPDEKLLIGVVRDLADLGERTDAVTKAGRSARVVANLSKLLSEQRRVVTGRLTNDGVPTEVIEAPTPTPGPTSGAPTGATSTSTPVATPTTSSRTSVAELTRRLTALTPTDWAAAAAAQPGNRDLVLSIRSVRLAAAALLGAPLAFRSDAPPTRSELVERTAPLVYGFEVVAAQASDDDRPRALAVLEGAGELLTALGAAPDSLPGGWALPFPVTTPKSANRLAQQLLSTAVAATTSLAPATADAASLEDIATWSARVQVLASRWGQPLTAFPGMGR